MLRSHQRPEAPAGGPGILVMPTISDAVVGNWLEKDPRSDCLNPFSKMWKTCAALLNSYLPESSEASSAHDSHAVH